LRVDLFNFELPEDRIALRPASPRDSAKMLTVRGAGLQDAAVSDLADFLKPGDALVFNDTKVIPAHLDGIRERDGVTAQISLTLHTRLSSSNWLAFARGAKKLVVGDQINFGISDKTCLAGRVVEKREAGEIEIAFEFSGPTFDEALIAAGKMPLPPYIASKRRTDERDAADYQTIYAREEGAVAAPTAGLHFTPELMARLEARGVTRHFVTLHVGPGTFLPMKSDDTADHVMHAEWGWVPKGVADALNQTRQSGGRIICVGTTSLRLLESAADKYGRIEVFEGDTDIFITPGYKFRAADMLLTNFHLPKSTLFMLVSAFSELETMQRAYAHAIQNHYRFYSYGDASLLYRAG